MTTSDKPRANGASAPSAGVTGRKSAPLAPPRILLLAAGVILQSVATWTLPFPHWLPVVLLALGLGALVAATCIRAPWRPPRRNTRGVGAYRALALAMLLALALSVALMSGLLLISFVPSVTTTRDYNSDAAAFNHYNAELTLHGVNPYTADARFWDAVGRFPSVGATPLRRGRYAIGPAPSFEQMLHDVHAEQTHPNLRGPEYDPTSLHSYPALAFLVYLPGVWLGLPSTAPTTLLFGFALLIAAGWDVRRGQRLLVWGLLLGNQFLLAGAERGSFEVVALLPALLAWRTLDRRWLSPILLGLACAIKQIAWPLLPFYVIIIWRREGPRAALTRTATALGAFLAPNLPFLVMAPRAWVQSIVLPMTLPTFPSGGGVIALAQAGLTPLWPSAVYSALELLALGGLLYWFARARVMPRPAVALVVALLPFLLAWRSLPSYFLVIPTLAVYAAIPLLQRDDAEAALAKPIISAS